jgi:serine/threonine-protein kinase HipA
MKRSLRVCIGTAAQRVGMLHGEAQRGRETSAFTYDASWIEAAHAFALDPQLPLVAGPQFPAVGRSSSSSPFPGAIADTEPDGWGQRVIRRDQVKRREVARAQGRPDPPPLTRMDFLLAVDDRSRVGALRMQDEQGVFQRDAQPDARTTPPLIELEHLLSASRAVEQHKETAADLAYLQGRGTSLGGLRPKCTVLEQDGMLAIGKFPSITDERSVTKGEVLALRLAADAGIMAASARLVSSDGHPVAVIRRFDRSADGGRLMYISAATMLGVDPHGFADHAYTQLVDAIREHGAAAQDDIIELWRRIAFSILITNVDDHLRNHGFLRASGGTWRLSPAFDLNPFPDKARELKTWISPESGPEATLENLFSICDYCHIPLPKARAILDEVQRAVARWRQVGQELGMSRGEIDAFASAFEHRESAAAGRGGPG